MDIPCPSCSKSFGNKRKLARHVRGVHNSQKFYCDHCKYETNFKHDLRRHIIRVHVMSNQSPEKRKKSVAHCPLCSAFSSDSRQEMISHYIKVHDVPLDEQQVELEDFGKFLTWKEGIEQSDIVQFAAQNGRKNRRDFVTRYYKCFRDGFFQRKGKGLRHVKVKCSNKINGVCPASMKVEESKATGIVYVTFTRTHVGHSQELGRMNLSKSDRADIAQKLAMGISHDAIIDNVRESIAADGVKRLHLTTRKDIWNLEISLRRSKKAIIPAEDSGVVKISLQERLNARKIEIRDRFEELLKDIENNEQADVLWQALLRVEPTLQAHSLISAGKLSLSLNGLRNDDDIS